MIKNIKIITIYKKEIISFNDETKLFFIEDNKTYYLNYKAIILGVIGNKLVLFVENSYVISMDYPSFLPGAVLYKGMIDTHTNSEKNIWIQRKNQIFSIDPEMKLSLYDEFDSVVLQGIIYLNELRTLAFFVQNEEGSKIFFESSNIPTLSFPGVFSIPELFFESSWGIIFLIGRTIVQYDIEQKKLRTSNATHSMKFNWKSLKLTFIYQITSTEIIVEGVESRVIQIEGDVWKVVNMGNRIYLFSDSINSPISIYCLSLDEHFRSLFCKTVSDYQVELRKNDCKQTYPLMVLSPKNNKNEEPTAIFFVHGGPHQKAGNLWDPLLGNFLSRGYFIYVPQYKGTIGIPMNETPLYGYDDFESLFPYYEQVQQKHNRIMIIGHSYGAFLALKLFLQTDADILFGINGVYDLLTISNLNPKTYAHIDKDTKNSRSPKYCSKSLRKKCEWHHIQFEKDPVIRNSDLMNSLENVGGKGPEIHYLNFHGHGLFNRIQSETIVEKIESIGNRFYNKPLYRQDYERLYC